MTRTGSLSWINANDVDRKDHYHAVDLYPDYYDNSFINALRIERGLLAAAQDAWRRTGSYLVTNAATGILAEGLLSEPQFSPGRTCLATFGELYGEGASIDIYEKDGNGYRLARRFERTEAAAKGFSLESMVWLTAAQVRISLKSRDRGAKVIQVSRSKRGDWQLKEAP